MALPVLDDIATRVRSCTACGLHVTRTNAVPGEGSATSEILFIGEGPGAKEDAAGRPFVGAAGKILEEMLASIHLTRDDVFITNVVKCRPPENRDPMPDEKAACRHFLDEQLAVLAPKLVVLLGRHALESILPGQSISKVHGHALRAKGQVYFPVFHPAATLYRRELRGELERDFQKIPLLLERLAQPGVHDDHVSPTMPDDALGAIGIPSAPVTPSENDPPHAAPSLF